MTQLTELRNGNEAHITAWFFIILITICFRIFKKRFKRRFYSTYGQELTKDNNDEIMYYYEKRYIIDLMNALALALVCVVYLYSMNVSFAFLSIAVWALILIFQPYIQSLISYLLLHTRFKIGDSIMIDENLWDIIFMKPLFTGIAWRNDLGEHTWETYIVPNNVFTSKIVSRLNIKAHDIRKNLISFVYDKDTFHVSYGELLKKLRVFLHELLPIRSIEECWPYKSYIGHRFKLHSRYDWKDLKITLWYLDSYIESRDSMEQVIWFIEDLKKEKTPLLYH